MAEDILKFFRKQEFYRFGGAILGAAIFAIGVNLFIVPAEIYNGGVLGFSQVIRTALERFFDFRIDSFDIAGVIYYIINIPLFLMAYKDIGKLFFVRTLISVTCITIFLSIFPIPLTPILPNDELASCVIGGIIAGYGTGICLKSGSCGGGLDIVGMYFIKKKGNFSVGKTSIAINLVLYIICLFMFDVSVVIYSIIYAVVSSAMIDRVHSQNINVEVIIVTSSFVKEIERDVLLEMDRGITQWEAVGAYTNTETKVLYVVLSKYEINQLKRIVHSYNPKAFIVVKEGAAIDGNYHKKI